MTLLQLEVDEAGPRDRDGVGLGQEPLQLLHDGRGDVHGVAAQRAGELHRDVRGVVAEVGVLRRLDDVEALLRFDVPRGLDGLAHSFVDPGFKITHIVLLLRPVRGGAFFPYKG